MIAKSLWSQLPEEVRQVFEKAAVNTTFKRGDYVYRAGENSKGLYFVKEGLIGLIMVGVSSGREHLLRFFRQDQFFGHRALFSNEGYHASALVMENSIVQMIPKTVVCEMLAKNPQLFREIINVMAIELRHAEEQHILILENEIVPRTASSLVYLKGIKPDHNWTRQEIANYCGSTVSTVIKAMAVLEGMGLIRQSGREITILERDKLIALQE